MAMNLLSVVPLLFYCHGKSVLCCLNVGIGVLFDLTQADLYFYVCFPCQQASSYMEVALALLSQCCMPCGQHGAMLAKVSVSWVMFWFSWLRVSEEQEQAWLNVFVQVCWFSAVKEKEKLTCQQAIRPRQSLGAGKLFQNNFLFLEVLTDFYMAQLELAIKFC